MTYADFESILVPKESYTNKYQKSIACSYGFKLACVMISLVSLLSILKYGCYLEFC